MTQLDASKVLGSPIATQLAERPNFFPAESYNQDFMTENPRHP